MSYPYDYPSPYGDPYGGGPVRPSHLCASSCLISLAIFSQYGGGGYPPGGPGGKLGTIAGAYIAFVLIIFE